MDVVLGVVVVLLAVGDAETAEQKQGTYACGTEQDHKPHGIHLLPFLTDKVPESFVDCCDWKELFQSGRIKEKYIHAIGVELHMAKIQAVVFDFDGLIVDTEVQWYNAVREIYAEYGADFTLEIFGSIVGTHSGPDFIERKLEELIGRPVDRPAVKAAYQARQRELSKGQRPRPGVEDYICAAKDLGLKIGLASSSHRDWIDRHLEELGLRHHFVHIRTADDVEKVKPDPALYLRVLEDLGVEPQHAIAFEDSPNGALAAHRAGMNVVIVPNLVTSPLPFGEHHLRLTSMAEMELEKVIEQIEGL